MAMRPTSPSDDSNTTPLAAEGAAATRAQIATELTSNRAAPVLRAVVRHFRGDDISLRAAALTYISVFSLVPLVTLATLLLSSLHQEAFHNALDGFVKSLLAPGVAPKIRENSAALLEEFIFAASSRAASFVSFIALVLTAGTLLKNLDGCLNELWAVRKKRPWPVRLFHYAVALTFGPPLLALSLFGTNALRSALVIAQVPSWVLFLGSFASPVIGLTLLYAYAPNAPVRFRPALLGGIAAGVGWSLARIGYAAFAARTFRYNLLYGSLGAVPLLLLWLYVSWLLVLFGARFAYAVQHAEYRNSWPLFELHPRGAELLAARIGQELARGWSEGTTPLSRKHLAKTLQVPEDTLIPALDALEQAGLVLFVEHGGLHPARDPATITLAQSCAAVRTKAPLPELRALVQKSLDLEQVEALISGADSIWASQLQGVTWADLAPGPRIYGVEDVPTPAPRRLGGGRNP